MKKTRKATKTIKKLRENYFSSWVTLDEIEAEADGSFFEFKAKDISDLELLLSDILATKKLISEGDAGNAANHALSIGLRWAAMKDKLETQPPKKKKVGHPFYEFLRQEYHRNPFDTQVSVIAGAKAAYAQARKTNPKLPKRLPLDNTLENNFLRCVKSPT